MTTLYLSVYSLHQNNLKEVLMQLYSLYMASSNYCYSEVNTNIILTLDKLDWLLTDQQFLEEQAYYIEGGITGRKVGVPDVHGNIEVTLQYIDCLGDFEETIITLVPVRSFINKEQNYD